MPPVAYARWLGVTVGHDCRLLTHDFGGEPFLVRIGDNVTISNDVLFLTHDGASWLIRDELGRRQHVSGITIGDWVFVGARSILMPGVTIGNHCIVGAGSVVTKSVPDGWVVAGNPARKISDYETYRVKALKYPSQKDFVGRSHKERCLMVAEPPSRKVMSAET